jgi:branched-chain amino acid transport system ATP-binding protein
MLLEVKGLCKNFGGLQVIRDLDFCVSEGQLTSVIGPNGAGKTTLFNVISGRFAPSSGKIIFEGKEISGLKPHVISQMGLARSFQITNVFGSLTVMENVLLACQSRLPERISLRKGSATFDGLAEKAEGILRRIGIAQHRDRPARELSHGDQRHLEIAMTLATDPKLLLLDEPTSGMSPAETAQTMDLIEEISRSVTVLLIEHDMHLVMNISHNIVVLDYGTKIAEGPPQEIKNNPEVRRVYLGGL